MQQTFADEQILGEKIRMPSHWGSSFATVWLHVACVPSEHGLQARPYALDPSSSIKWSCSVCSASTDPLCKGHHVSFGGPRFASFFRGAKRTNQHLHSVALCLGTSGVGGQIERLDRVVGLAKCRGPAEPNWVHAIRIPVNPITARRRSLQDPPLASELGSQRPSSFNRWGWHPQGAVAAAGIGEGDECARSRDVVGDQGMYCLHPVAGARHSFVSSRPWMHGRLRTFSSARALCCR